MIAVGDGKVPTSSLTEGSEPYWIQIPPELYVDPKDDGKKVVIDTVYRDLHNMSGDADYFKNRAILTPLNDDVDCINTEVLKLFPG